jgi:chemotaxis protein histidine kinase CheA
MTPPLGMSDFFALEAGEYLERLDAALAAPSAPSAAEIVRLGRALRGSALMANQPAIARAAGGLEALARAVQDGRRAWDAATQQLAVRAVDDLKIFVRRATSWTEVDTAKAEALAAELEQLAGRPSPLARPARPPEPPGLDAGARAFVAREGAAIASALDRAAHALRANPLAHDPLQHVLRTLQPLRGLAVVNDLPPLPDLLDGVERAIAELSRPAAAPPTETAELFQAAAGAIARAAREVAERGRPEPDAEEFRRFTDLLVRLLEREPDVVAIAALYYDDAGPHILARGTPGAGPPALGRLELVSHGEHLRQAADSLERAASTTQRELRAHTLAATFRALATAGGGALADQVAEFAMAARDAVAAGAAVAQPGAFAAALRTVGDLLARAGAGDDETLAAELDAPTAALRALVAGPQPPPPVAAPASTPTPTPASAPAPAPAEEPVPETPDLAGSWTAYQRLVAAGVGPPSLEALLGAPAEPPVVDVRTLLYRGERALERAREVRAAAREASGDALRALVDEVCDLVALALEQHP